MKRFLKIFGYSIVKENDLIDLESRYRGKIAERINLFMHPDTDQKVWNKINELYPLKEESKRIFGVRGNIKIPHISKPQPVGGVDEYSMNDQQFGFYEINMFPMIEYPDFKLGYNKERDILCIGNDKIWE